MRWREYLTNAWYQDSALITTLLTPVGKLYQKIMEYRREWYQRHAVSKVSHFKVPIIVVGNITVGGTGKTPLVIWLAKFLQENGFRPGIVTRGYGGKADAYPLTVKADSNPLKVGDEAVLLARTSGVPVVIDPNRVNAVKHLLKTTDCNVVISDDGLQHYALGRQIEIAVIDSERRFGNEKCLPAGPLREPLSRLDAVDFRVANVNGGEAAEDEYTMQLVPGNIYNLSEPSLIADVDDFAGHALHAVAGIGNPNRFFIMLRKLGLTIWPHAFPDHHHYTEKDIQFDVDDKIIMTEKDAVKCEDIADYRYWCLPVTANLEPDFEKALLRKLLEVVEVKKGMAS